MKKECLVCLLMSSMKLYFQLTPPTQRSVFLFSISLHEYQSLFVSSYRVCFFWFQRKAKYHYHPKSVAEQVPVPVQVNQVFLLHLLLCREKRRYRWSDIQNIYVINWYLSFRISHAAKFRTARLHRSFQPISILLNCDCRVNISNFQEAVQDSNTGQKDIIMVGYQEDQECKLYF